MGIQQPVYIQRAVFRYVNATLNQLFHGYIQVGGHAIHLFQTVRMFKIYKVPVLQAIPAFSAPVA